ncbi:hypothetical protein CEXT_100991 [Caerostris extrusa]|uniref:Uncharacterized protein n=1 Tax=Caerostris extrusa TaxID=172846 RepID=A0AAV4MEJ6_CAEEX|nr:hypothetical protein CEXT_100991 [Caerostris extrusa]
MLYVLLRYTCKWTSACKSSSDFPVGGKAIICKISFDTHLFHSHRVKISGHVHLRNHLEKQGNNSLSRVLCHSKRQWYWDTEYFCIIKCFGQLAN